jgi:hypothetical protein
MLSFSSFHCHSLPHCSSLSYLSKLFLIIGVYSLLLALVLFCFNLVFPPLLYASLNARSLNNLRFKPSSFINVSILGFSFWSFFFLNLGFNDWLFLFLWLFVDYVCCLIVCFCMFVYWLLHLFCFLDMLVIFVIHMLNHSSFLLVVSKIYLTFYENPWIALHLHLAFTLFCMRRIIWVSLTL